MRVTLYPCSRVTMRQPNRVTVSQCHRVTMLQCNCVPRVPVYPVVPCNQPCNRVSVKPWHCATMQPCNQQCKRVTVYPCNLAAVWQCNRIRAKGPQYQLMRTSRGMKKHCWTLLDQPKGRQVDIWRKTVAAPRGPRAGGNTRNKNINNAPPQPSVRDGECQISHHLEAGHAANASPKRERSTHNPS